LEGVMMVRMFRIAALIVTLALAVGLVSAASAQTLKDAAARSRPLAERGEAKWQYFLGLCYEVGSGGVERDYAEALKWYRKAAEQGYGDGLAGMGGMYARGRGVPKNYMLAEMYVELAETQHAEPVDLKMTRAVVRQHVTKAQTAEAKTRAAACVSAHFRDCDKI
jgi:TPR repeat protein